MVTVRPSESPETQKSIPLPDKPPAVGERHLSAVTAASDVLTDSLSGFKDLSLTASTDKVGKGF